MSLSDPRTIFGVHSVTPYSRTNGLPYGTLRVLGGSSLSLSGALISLNGGSSKYPWAVEDGLVTAELALKIKEYPDFLFELFLGKAPTPVNTPDTDGTVSTLTNYLGSTAKSATIGVASVAATASTGPAALKFGKYMIKVASATTINVYASSNIDFARGTSTDYSSDALLVAGPLTITSATGTDVAALGLTFTGGSGTIGMTTGDTAYFYVQEPFTKSMSVDIGANSDTFPEFGALVYAKKRGNLEMTEIELYRCKAVGLPLGFQENTFSEADVKVQSFYDSALNKVFSLRHISPSS